MNENRTGRRDTRAGLERLRGFLQQDPVLADRYRLAKQVVRTFRNPAFYEMSQRCNLFCEGCYYFENKSRHDTSDEADLQRWTHFFETEQRRNVSMAYFVGAEPALEKQRLRAAVGRIPYGKIGTNGTIFIDRDITFRIGVSVWGDDETDASLRGGSVLRKALRNYRGDPRAVMLFTLSPWNLHTVPDVISACRDHDLPVTFSMFSPTSTYLEKIARDLPADGKYYRLAASRGAPVFTEFDLAKARDVMTRAYDEFSDNVLTCLAYINWITRPGPLYDLDEMTGIASNCASRIVEPLRYHTGNLKPATVKCCTPDVDCSQCRLYSGAWSTHLQPVSGYLENARLFSEWLSIIETLGQIFLYPAPPRYELETERPVASAAC
ncbi:hypothetical protein [Microbaculum marinum]|uniref:Radical SAM protein n=1 Tax=Microbaculum marinum TaxID=1764581 RepID=A0AAW9RN44_9HYPH